MKTVYTDEFSGDDALTYVNYENRMHRIELVKHGAIIHDYDIAFRYDSNEDRMVYKGYIKYTD